MLEYQRVRKEATINEYKDFNKIGIYYLLRDL